MSKLPFDASALHERFDRFDHARLPERVVNARGAGAHGYFEAYESMASLTRADFLSEKGRCTPVFVRFSTVAGFRGSTDLARDVRGFAVRFYTDEGNYDLVGNNMPVFFIQDAMAFPDLIQAAKAELHDGMPRAATAQDAYWEFISRLPESMHMIMWAMSDRAIPRSYRMMEGFGVHTFRLVNAAGEGRFVKFHWKPALGLHAVTWDEAIRISGNDPDFHRRDLFDAIQAGNFPEWEFGVQVVDEKDRHAFDFDLFDPTKLIPEEVVPVRPVGKLVLDRNPRNPFAETEQVAFHPGHVVPGIDLSGDPLLQGRVATYAHAQAARLGATAAHALPINRGSSSPPGGNGHAVRTDAFLDHFTQARMFLHSQSEPEYNHICHALEFELGKVGSVSVRERMLYMLAQVDADMAASVGKGLGMPVPRKSAGLLNGRVPDGADPRKVQPPPARDVPVSPALSMASSRKRGIATRKVAVLLADGYDRGDLATMRKALESAGAWVRIVAPQLGAIPSHHDAVQADFSFRTGDSVLFDAIYIPGGRKSVDVLKRHVEVGDFVRDSWRHCKPIAASGAGAELLSGLPRGSVGPKAVHGVVVAPGKASHALAEAFVQAIASGRHWARETLA
ncbi:MAG TPA: catalase [Luteibacter sp.]|uniref:catalase n=1 Tax=Luteibacter sp. TaxID=1886636 RepID=UPI002B83FCDD|nr:catalase [Luteibacter sp.]HVI54791.1 catalase [Luteibacter sp.]